jgi:hypothetical protein
MPDLTQEDRVAIADRLMSEFGLTRDRVERMLDASNQFAVPSTFRQLDDGSITVDIEMRKDWGFVRAVFHAPRLAKGEKAPDHRRGCHGSMDGRWLHVAVVVRPGGGGECLACRASWGEGHAAPGPGMMRV